MTKPVPTHDLLARAQRRLAAQFERHMTEAGFAELSLPLGANVLRWLFGDHGQRVGDLSRLSGMSKQAISQQARTSPSTGMSGSPAMQATHGPKSSA